MSVESMTSSNHLILCQPLLLPSIFPSIRIFSNKSVLCIQWPKYWSFSLSISPSNDYSGLLSFRIDWFDLLTVQGTLKSSPAPQFESISSSALNLYEVQLSHLNMTTLKTIALTIWTFVSKVISLLFNMLSRLAIAFEQASFNFVATVTIYRDFGAQENKICHCFQFFPIYLSLSDGI